ncbi:unnamed protein product, partial [Meganyctiphanes norvegica]
MEGKAKKKIKRCLCLLEKEHNICASETPTRFLFVGNAGLTTGADEASLVEVFSSNSCLESLTMVPGKQYSFATFTSEQRAQEIYEAVHGKIGINSSDNPLYMAYVDRNTPVPIKYKFKSGFMCIQRDITYKTDALLIIFVFTAAGPLNNIDEYSLKHRQVRHFGYEFKYGSNCVDKDEPLMDQIPELLNPILEKITSQNIMEYTPDQLTVNRYLPGQGIPPHVDTHSSFTDEILSLSLGSAVIMDFREVSEDGQHYAVYLPPRSLCIMSGPARYIWSHGICPRMTDVVPSVSGLHLHSRKERVSFTFRKIRSGECPCEHTKVCDSFIRNQLENFDKDNDSGSIDIKSAWELEHQHVQKVYDQIAPHFSQTRHKPWPRVLQFIYLLYKGSFLLEVGCTGTKKIPLLPKTWSLGCDTSVELLKICQDRGHEVFATNCLSLPYRDANVDAVISIAVIHHLCTKERRRASFQEMHRVLRIGGRGLIYVWAVEQERGNKLSAYLKQNKNNRYSQSYAGIVLSGELKSGVDRRNKSVNDTYEEESTGKEINSENINENSKLPSSLPIHKNRTEFIQQDMLVPWKLKPQKITKQNKAQDGSKKDKSQNKKQNKAQDGSKNDKPIHESAINDTNETLSNFHITNNSKIIRSNEKDITAGDLSSSKDLSVPVFNRYYHVFREGELENLIEEVEGLKVVETYYDEGNWCCIFEKLL